MTALKRGSRMVLPVATESRVGGKGDPQFLFRSCVGMALAALASVHGASTRLPGTRSSPVAVRFPRRRIGTHHPVAVGRVRLVLTGKLRSSDNSALQAAMALEKAKEIVTSSPVVVFSKTYCPFCTQVKQLLTQLGASYKAIELDVESDGAELQSALAEWTGQRTVPNVFVKGERIGGCDATMAMHDGGMLVPRLTEAGAIVTVEATATASPSL